ncbi:DUF5682 family protein [Longispora albida]|uniref:DUF5682 family protein n=1 Tax=Longispora albida TaxID=203523 RepID=UPI00039F87CB|nr:DUF5682 family protein [Longispora albida]
MSLRAEQSSAALQALSTSEDPAEVAGRLAGSTDPFLIGVRHHSPALAGAVPALLDGFRPDVLLLELPPELEPWLSWLADPGTVAPVALAGVAKGEGPAFYPFADFSPELAAIRWAAEHGVRVVPCDLPLADGAWRSREGEPVIAGAQPVAWLGNALRASATGRDHEDMWDRTVEAPAPGSGPEAIRRAALLVGWAMRQDTVDGAGVSRLDLRREAWMRRCLAAESGRVAVLAGAFHTPVLDRGGEVAPDPVPAGEVATSLVPYTFGLLDERSGYPAGIRDPGWQQAVLEADGDPSRVEGAAAAAITAICAGLRAQGHPAGPAEAREALRLAIDLASLRGLPAPGRGEIVEAVQSVLAAGEVLGRGRAVATAMEKVMVGERRGVLAPGAPRSGLRPAVLGELAALRLPGPGDPEKEMRLEPLRSDLDRRREITLRRLTACGVSYGSETAVAGLGGGDAFSTRWTMRWTPQAEAMTDLAGMRGVTLAQAAAGALAEQYRRATADGGPMPADVIGGLGSAAECGLRTVAAERLAELGTVVPASASLPELAGALALLDRLRAGHIPGMSPENLPDLDAVTSEVEDAAVRQLDGLAGSADPADARALAALAQRSAAAGTLLRLTSALGRLAADGVPLIGAAAQVVLVLIGAEDAAVLARRVTSWVDNASAPESRRQLQDRLAGLLTVAEPLMQAGGPVFEALCERVEYLADGEFLGRLPALRGGFQAASPAGRTRLLSVVSDRLGGGARLNDSVDPALLLARVRADLAGRAALEAAGLIPAGLLPDGATAAGEPARLLPGEPVPVELVDGVPVSRGAESALVSTVPVAERHLSTLDRWRLLLGRENESLAGSARRYATALDELYGIGQGEGAAAEAAARAGQEASFPSVREWAGELAALFGEGVREEVLASAIESGRLDVAAHLDPERVRPSVELLQSVLTLAGGLPEGAVAKLRPLVARLVSELTRQLATRLRSALSGLSTPRPTRRSGGKLNLPATIRANLATTRRLPDGSVQVIPEKPIFGTRARKGVDWRLILVVDVSGSMEASVIWSALTASVLAGVPALSTHFLAFSTEVADFTDRVSDPLSLLLEVKVGGGTHIAAGLRHARSLVRVPSRTMVVVVSDFEEGYPVSGLLAETRALAESGCTVLGCASLDDGGQPRYSVPIAQQLVAAGMPVAALSPLELARWVGEKVR